MRKLVISKVKFGARSQVLFCGQNSFVGHIFGFLSFFCLNLAKKCQKWSLRENLILTLFVVFLVYKNGPFCAQKLIFLAIFWDFLAIVCLNLTKKCKKWSLTEKVTFHFFGGSKMQFFGQKLIFGHIFGLILANIFFYSKWSFLVTKSHFLVISLDFLLF